jgi:PIN domain nuclease of toxin-antitoxin system
MKFLLDTHTFIWMADSPDKISERATAIIQDKENILLLSYVSIWEIQIKVHLGKLTLSKALSEIVQEQQNNELKLLPIELSHLYDLARLKDHHRDPFDRLLIAQAVVEKLPIISNDALFTNYPIRVVW